MPDEAQPAAPQEGQGPQDDAQALYADVLEGLPEEHHGTLTERLKAREADLNKAHQSKMEGWQPYEEMGINQVDPEALSGLMNLGQALEAAGNGDPQALQDLQEWWGNIGQSLGFSDQGQGEEEGQASDLLDLKPEQLQEMVGEQVAEKINPLLEQMQQQQQQKLLADAEQEVADSLSTLRKENPNITDEDESRILAFAYMFGGDAEDPITQGFEEFKKVAARGESELFGQKLNQPNAAEGAGRPNTVPKDITSWDDAKEASAERMRQALHQQ